MRDFKSLAIFRGFVIVFVKYKERRLIDLSEDCARGTFFNVAIDRVRLTARLSHAARVMMSALPPLVALVVGRL